MNLDFRQYHFSIRHQVLALAALFSGCNAGFEAVSVYPRLVYDHTRDQIFIYGHGFEEGSTAAITWTDTTTGLLGEAQIPDVEYLDPYTLRVTLPDLSQNLTYPIYPYHEFIDYSALASHPATPGLYHCTQNGETKNLEPVIWDHITSTGYSDSACLPLELVASNSQVRLVPPGSGDSDPFQYATWYEYLYYCSLNNDPYSTNLTQEEISRLIPDYGLGCFYPLAYETDAGSYGGIDDSGHPVTFSYCPAEIPAIEVNISVTLPNGKSSRIDRGLTLLDWDNDYYFNERFADHVGGYFGRYRDISVGGSPALITANYLNDDTYPDLVIVDPDSSWGTVVTGPYFDLNDPESTYVGVASVGLTPIDVASGDVDGDGISDIITANSGTNDLTVLFGREIDDGGVIYIDHSVDSYTLPLVVDGTTVQPSEIAIGDLEPDGRDEIIVVSEEEKLLFIAKIAPSGTDGELRNPITIADGPATILVGDLNGDSVPDVVTANPSGRSLTSLINVGTGSGTFGARKDIDLGFAPGRFATMSAWNKTELSVQDGSADLNGDRVVDLVVQNLDTIVDADSGAVSSAVISLIGVGDGSFTAPRETLVVGATVALVLVLADRDTYVDLVVSTEGEGGVVSVYNNDSLGNFTHFSDLYTSGTITDIATADYDGDLDSDVLLANSDSGFVRVSLNPSIIYEYYRYFLQRCRI